MTDSGVLRPNVPGLDLDELIGYGEQGEVWHAKDVVVGDQVAVKLAQDHSDPSTRAAADREIALLQRIEHPHVVKVRHAIRLADGRTALVMELAGGGNLASLIARRGRLDPAEVSTLLVPLAGALQHLHGLGLAHGDISPGNVLFSARGRPLLADLGVARILDAAGTEAWGTPGFVDPARTADSDPRRGDVWGLAAVAWFALTGQPPGDGNRSSAAAGTAVVLAPALTRLLAECLSSDPSARPEPADVAARAWQAARPVPIRLMTPGRPDPLVTAITRRRPAPEPAAVPNDPERSRFGWWKRHSRRTAGGTGEATGGDVAGIAGAGGASAGSARPLSPAGPSRSRVGPSRRRTDAAATSRPGRRTPSWERKRRRWWPIPAMLLALLTVLVGMAAWAVLDGWMPGSRAGSVLIGSASTGSASNGSSAESVSAESTSAGSVSAASVTDAALAAALVAAGQARAAAFAAASAAPLAKADQPGSPAMAADGALIDRLRAAGLRLAGVRYLIRDVHRISSGRGQVSVALRVSTSQHRRVRPDGRLVAVVPAEPARQLTVLLVAGSSGWLVQEVT